MSVSAPTGLGMEIFAPGENHVRAADRRRWRLVRHVPVGGVAMDTSYASSAGLRILAAVLGPASGYGRGNPP